MIFLSVFIGLASLGFVFYPLFRYESNRSVAADVELEELITERDNLYVTIKDLEFDHLAGKLNDQDYENLRSQYEAQAIQVLHQLDARVNYHPALESDDQREEDLVEKEIQGYIQRRKQARSLSEQTDQ